MQRRTVAEMPMQVGPDKFLGRVVGLPPAHQPSVNRVELTSGSYLSPGRPAGVLVEQHLADDFDLSPGDSLVVNGATGPRRVQVLGVAASPEYFWPAPSRQDVLAPAEILRGHLRARGTHPEPRRARRAEPGRGLLPGRQGRHGADQAPDGEADTAGASRRAHQGRAALQQRPAGGRQRLPHPGDPLPPALPDGSGARRLGADPPAGHRAAPDHRDAARLRLRPRPDHPPLPALRPGRRHRGLGAGRDRRRAARGGRHPRVREGAADPGDGGERLADHDRPRDPLRRHGHPGRLRAARSLRRENPSRRGDAPLRPHRRRPPQPRRASPAAARLAPGSLPDGDPIDRAEPASHPVDRARAWSLRSA